MWKTAAIPYRAYLDSTTKSIDCGIYGVRRQPRKHSGDAALESAGGTEATKRRRRFALPAHSKWWYIQDALPPKLFARYGILKRIPRNCFKNSYYQKGCKKCHACKLIGFAKACRFCLPSQPPRERVNSEPNAARYGALKTFGCHRYVIFNRGPKK